MVIRTSSSKEIAKLVAQLREGSPVQREAAIARLRVIGARAIDRLVAVLRASAPAIVHASALKALEGIDDVRSRDLALESLKASSPAVAVAAVATLRHWLASDPLVLDAIIGLALDTGRDASVRLAALDALSELPRATVQPVLQQVGGSDPGLAAKATSDVPRAIFEQPAGFTDWLVVRGASAPLSEIHDAIVRIRAHERDEPSARLRQEWQIARAAAHAALAKRGSRVALYDIRETFDEAPGPLPLDFLTAVTINGDASCLEPLARAWATAGNEAWWRDRLRDAVQAIVTREKLTARHSSIRKLRARFPGLV
jgi:hypothetical protein